METQIEQTPSFSPPAVVDTVSCAGKSLHVVREDLLPGGTKQRAILPYLRTLLATGFRHFVYASPFAGFAQVALSSACQQLNVECTILAEKAPSGGLHEFSRLAQKNGARVLLVDDLSQASREATRLEECIALTKQIPLGFDCPSYKSFMLSEVQQQWEDIERKVASPIKNLWVAVGSGTLTQVFLKFLNPKTQVCGVNVHVLPGDDSRIQKLNENSRVRLFSAPEPFAEAARRPPSLPSNLHYDAKLWDLLAKHANDGDIWWNVAR